MKKIIPYGKHYIDQDDINSVVDILKNKNLTQGPTVLAFEKAVANFVGSKYAVAMSSWTAGLHMAYLAAGLKENDKIITSPVTFVATSNAALYCNAKPIFSDIDPETINLCSKQLEEKVQNIDNIKIISPVHFSGLPCDMKEIKRIADKHKITVIEDAAHALGAKYKDGTMVGNCKYSDMTGFSFHPVKSIAAGEGGMITTNNKRLYKKLLKLRSHGINKLDDKLINTELAFTGDIKNPWYYEMQELGYNYRITDIQCALGQSQLKKLNKFIERRLELVLRYDKAFATFNNVKPIQKKYRKLSSHHLYVVEINFSNLEINRVKLMTELRNEGILTQVHYMPVTSHPYYMSLGYKTCNYRNSVDYYNKCLSLPLYYSLTNDDQSKVIKLLKSLLN
mgnify:FL=1|tara:strand:+ start:14912 stop:16093 length:1182 start_codon:yes stop_codon:yes gene_type:complete